MPPTEPILYESTRGGGEPIDFEAAVLAGLAPDGGLYVPTRFPRLTAATLRSLRGASYHEVARRVLLPFVQPSLTENELGDLIEAAYADFDDPAIAPLRPLGGGPGGAGLHLLELFHGPTLAFKDLALQLLGQLFARFLARRGGHATVLGATSGDTGSAAIAGCRGLPGLDIVILHPHGRTSAVQRRQMTTILDDNVHNFAVRGSFDDCQAMVKALFRDADARDTYGLRAVNSINTARVLAQIVYYVSAAVALGAPEQPVRFCVPTGNFGDVLAGHWARRMGLPVAELVIATNANDILARTLETGRYGKGGVEPTLSPSMDIQVSSNFERLLYELHGDDPAAVHAAMAALDSEGGFNISAGPLRSLRAGFAADRADDAATLAMIDLTHRTRGLLVDPHTAVGLHAALRRCASDEPGDPPMVVLATAHPAKFPDAVRRATGLTPGLPVALADLMSRRERFDIIDADAEALREKLSELQG